VQNIDSKILEIESKMHIVDSHSQSLAKLEAQLGQISHSYMEREGEKFLVTPYKILKANNLNNWKLSWF